MSAILLFERSFKSLNTLQLVQNATAQVLAITKKIDDIYSALTSQLWLPVKSGIDI